jgi:catecholate siderophore receptor
VVALDPVRNTTWELGAKINLFGHLDVNGAFFGVTREGVAIQVGAGPTATIGTQDQEVLGTEVTVAGNVTKNWSLAGGFTMFDAKIVNSAVASQNGSAFPNVSELTFTLTSRHKITDRLHAGVTYVAQGEKFGGTVIAGSTRLPGFERVDLFGGYKLRDDIEIRFNVFNVTDETYFDALYRSATPFTYVAPGRSAQVTLDWHF